MAQLTEEQMEDITLAFQLFDRNNDGRISKAEIGQVLRKMGQNPTKSEIDSIMSEVDIDGNDHIEFREFIDMMARRGVKSQSELEAEMEEAFKVFDRNNDGKISASELRQTLSNLGDKMTDEEINNMMREADIDGDGKVDYYEFAKIICSR